MKQFGAWGLAVLSSLSCGQAAAAPMENVAPVQDLQATRQEIAALQTKLQELERRLVATEKGQHQVQEKVAKTSPVKFSGMAGIQLDTEKKEHKDFKDRGSKIYADLHMSVDLPSDWKLELLQKTERSLKNTADTYTNNTETLAFSGNIGKVKVTLGRFYYFTDEWNVIGDTWVTGMKLDFGKAIKYSLVGARLRDTSYAGSYPVWGNGFVNSGDHAKYGAVSVHSQITPRLYFGGTAHCVNNHGSVKVYEALVRYQFAPHWQISYNPYWSSLKNMPTGNFGYYVGVNYKKADIKKPHSFDIFVNYRTLPRGAQIDTGSPWLFDKRTLRIGADYTLLKNVMLTMFYQNCINIADNQRYQGARLSVKTVF